MVNWLWIQLEYGNTSLKHLCNFVYFRETVVQIVSQEDVSTTGVTEETAELVAEAVPEEELTHVRNFTGNLY